MSKDWRYAYINLCYNLWHKSAPKSVKDVNTPAQSIKLGLSKEVVTVVADPVESREDGGVIDALALEVEEGAARDVVGRRGRRGGRGRRPERQRHQSRAQHLHWG